MEVAVDSAPGRDRRRWKRVAVAGGVLAAAPIFGLLGTFGGIWMSYRKIQSGAAPTRGELDEGAWVSVTATTAGFVLGAAGVLLLVIGLVRMYRIDASGELAGCPGRGSG